MRNRRYFWVVVAVGILGIGTGLAVVFRLAPTSEQRVIKYKTGNAYLAIEVLDDDLVHFEFGTGAGPDAISPLYTTPMVHKTDYAGPARLSNDGRGILETAALKLTVEAGSLCVTLADTTRQPAVTLTQLCPQLLENEPESLSLAPYGIEHVYGLGEHFPAPNTANGDWAGQLVKPGSPVGNAMLPYNGGYTSNAQFPIMYALGDAGENYALFLDHVYAQTWDLTSTPWVISTEGGPVRGYLMTGPDLPDLRSDYIELVGRPPVPPKKMFGLWVSEYGYDNWAELEDKLSTLRANRFPVDGFVMDLQWFGGVRAPSHMGNVDWDTEQFPNHAQKIASLRDEQGIGLMLIEESYVDATRPEHKTLTELGYFPRRCDGCSPVHVFGWWGDGGMLDWTNPAAGDYWHDTKRQPLVDMGVMGHWTDLGEPELYFDKAWYAGLPQLDLHSHRDIHNLYNFKWIESIYRGYARNNAVGARPFVLSRSGTSGIQRFGVSMWSGDIGSNLSSLTAHFNVQMHMSFSGVDYFGADIGGFRRSGLDGDLDEMYTQWFANGMLFDIPGRPHTDNTCDCYETAPDRVGHLRSNLESARLRYSLIPYMYSLAHRAYLYGEPVVPPLVLYYQDDPNVRQMGDQKLLGRDLLAATVSAYGQTERDVYLPAGVWVNYYTNEWVSSAGEWIRGAPTQVDRVFRLPLFARAGAIIPQMYVDEQTMNALGKRLDGSVRDELIVRVYADAQPTSFTLYEDDGATMAYQQGAVRTTLISQQQVGDVVRVTIDPAAGSYDSAPASRDNVLYLFVRDAGRTRQAVELSLNGDSLARQPDRAAFDAAASGWYAAGNGLILAKTGRLDVDQRQVFEVRLEK